MYLNSKEETIIGNFLTDMGKSNSTELYRIEWESGTTILAYCDTMYESDNNLELNDPNYEEYWGVALRIKLIIVDGEELCERKEGQLFEVSYHNAPKIWVKINNQ